MSDMIANKKSSFNPFFKCACSSYTVSTHCSSSTSHSSNIESNLHSILESKNNAMSPLDFFEQSSESFVESSSPYYQQLNTNIFLLSNNNSDLNFTQLIQKFIRDHNHIKIYYDS